MLDKLNHAAFAGQLNQVFRLRLESDALALELIEAKELGQGGEDGGRRAFSLLFRGPAEPLLDQGTFSLEHGEMGELELFLVPIGRDDAGCLYEAVFT